MSMVTVGDSLDQTTTLVAQARTKADYDGDICKGCRTNGHPRGFNPHTRLCWWCTFPLLHSSGKPFHGDWPR